MKKSILLLSMVTVSCTVFAQIGFHTPNPQGSFHVDGAKDNPATGVPTAVQQSNDFILLSNGNVGIGTVNPTNKLDVRSATAGALRIVDGTQGTGKTLTSDANGVATWQTSSANVILGSAVGGYNLPFTKFSAYRYTGASIQLPPGKWIVTISQLLNIAGGTVTNNDWLFVRSTFSEQNLTTIGEAGTMSADVSGPKLMSFKVLGTGNYDTATGTILINNTSNQTKTYKYIAGSTEGGLPSTTTVYLNGFAGGWAENSIYASAIN